MLPTREVAEALVREAEKCNPGPWGEHSRIAARCAERIAALCPDLDAERAYILALLHDIGRKFGVWHMRHVYHGYTYMISLGYDDAAKICLTHSFNNKNIDEYVGKNDCTDEEYAVIKSALDALEFDEYDRLVQLCDALAGGERVLKMEDRMADIKRRYGRYPEAKWQKNLELRRHFEEKTGKDIYDIV